MLCNERSMSFSSLKAGTIIEIFTLTVCTLDHKEVDYIANLSNTDACWLMRSSGQSGVVRSSDLLSQLPFCAATERDAVLVPRPRKNVLRNKDAVDDVDHTVARFDVGLSDIRAANGHLAGVHLDGQFLAIQGLGIGRCKIRGH